MKKAKGEMRSEYRRSDFAKLERGKFYAEVAAGTSVALLEPAIAGAFPTSKSVNEALAGLLVLTEKTSRITALNTDARKSGARRLARRYKASACDAGEPPIGYTAQDFNSEEATC